MARRRAGGLVSALVWAACRAQDCLVSDLDVVFPALPNATGNVTADCGGAAAAVAPGGVCSLSYTDGPAACDSATCAAGGVWDASQLSCAPAHWAYRYEVDFVGTLQESAAGTPAMHDAMLRYIVEGMLGRALCPRCVMERAQTIRDPLGYRARVEFPVDPPATALQLRTALEAAWTAALGDPTSELVAKFQVTTPFVHAALVPLPKLPPPATSSPPPAAGNGTTGGGNTTGGGTPSPLLFPNRNQQGAAGSGDDDDDDGDVLILILVILAVLLLLAIALVCWLVHRKKKKERQLPEPLHSAPAVNPGSFYSPMASPATAASQRSPPLRPRSFVVLEELQDEWKPQYDDSYNHSSRLGHSSSASFPRGHSSSDPLAMDSSQKITKPPRRPDNLLRLSSGI
eukprot:TRINITY_DN2474_c1_g2_i1.p1 TRINITY_DN2474_c1_g2~~TRINITY_DN2474_c1_g2_i1.p1  ORF type:complete len:424 (+),score=99.24 TRINITY_DN2474_c1_g2_i1:75-1274(+)